MIATLIEFATGMFNRIPGSFFENMISFLVADIVEIFYTVLLPFIRISAMLIVAPVLSMDSVTVRIRIIIAIALTIAIYPVLDWPFIDPVSGDGLVEIFQQALMELLWVVLTSNYRSICSCWADNFNYDGTSNGNSC